MARKKKALPLLEGVTIQNIAAEGKSLVRGGENGEAFIRPHCTLLPSFRGLWWL